MSHDFQSVYRPDIDGLRAVAVLSVIVYHLNNSFLPGGYTGVDIFFVISGFVVASSLVGSQAGSFPSFLSEFYARRLARILPALVLMLIVSVIMATLFIPNAWLSQLSDKTAKYAFFGLSNVVMQFNTDTYFAPRAEFNPYTHTWSLSVEEQYYVLAPLFVFFWIRAHRQHRISHARMAVVGLFLVMLASLAFAIWASKANPAAAFYSIGSRLWELAIGALLFLVTCERRLTAFAPTWFVQHKAVVQAGAAWLGVGLVGAGFVYADSASFPWPWALVPVVGALLLIGGAGVGRSDAVRSALASFLAVWIGRRSYSLYLWHWPVFVMMRWTTGLAGAWLFAVAITLTFALATLSYRFVELPLRHSTWIESQARWLRITFFLLMPLSGLLLATHFFDHRYRYSLSDVARHSNDWYVGERMPYANVGERTCDVSINYLKVAGGEESRYVPQRCGTSQFGKKIFVLGDSHAGMLKPLFDQIAAEEGIQVSLFSLPGCSFIDFYTPMGLAHRSVACQAFTKAISEQIAGSGNAGDIVILSSLRMNRYGDQWGSFNVPDMHDAMYNPKALKLRLAALDDAIIWLQPFADKKLKVVFTAPTPVFKAPPFRCSDWFNSANPICIGKNQQFRSELEKLRQPIIDSMTKFTQTLPDVSVWDPFPLLCPNSICLTQRDGRPLFFDGDHLSAFGNLQIYPDFKKMIMALK